MKKSTEQSLPNGGINTQRVLQGDVFAKSELTTPVMYVIEGDCTLESDVMLSKGSILRFVGGAIFAKEGERCVISGENITIEAPKYQVFGENVSFNKGTIANGEVSAHWWGAIGDEVTDDAIAINRALDNAGTSWVVLDNLVYKIDNPIVLSEKGQKLRCYGTIKYIGSECAIELKESYLSLEINSLIGDNSGSALLFSGSVFHGNVNVNSIENFYYGFNLTPIGTGIQYCKISWQSVRCNTGIYIDLWHQSNQIIKKTVWVNENQFHGGRLCCQFGIVVANKQSNTIRDEDSYTADLINGNVFNCIGFEGWNDVKITPIKLCHAWYNEFRDLRMSESLIGQNNENNDPWISLEDCGYNTMNIKSIIPFSRVQAVNCNNIELRGSFTDKGYGYHKGYDKMYIVSANTAYRTPTQSNLVGFVETFKLLSSRIQPRNAIKRLRLGDNAGNENQTINFNNLFLSPYDVNVVDDVKLLSDVVEIGVYNNSILSINIADSIVGICPEVEMRCDIEDGSKLKIIKQDVKNNIDEVLFTITTSGNYRITFDEARNLKVIRMA